MTIFIYIGDSKESIKTASINNEFIYRRPPKLR